MSAPFKPIPLDAFDEKVRPHIRRLNETLMDLDRLKGAMKRSVTTSSGGDSVKQTDDVLVHVSRVTPDLNEIVSGQSTVVGTPALTLTTTNVKGTTTTAIATNSSIALFEDNQAPLGITSITGTVGTSAFAARADHRHPSNLINNQSVLACINAGEEIPVTVTNNAVLGRQAANILAVECSADSVIGRTNSTIRSIPISSIASVAGVSISGTSDTQVLFNDGGAIGSEANFVYDKAGNVLGVTGTIDVVGDVTVSGNVDGRDVSVDGTKLDTIETNADVTDAANVDAAGAVMESDFTAKGDLLSATSGPPITPSILSVGTDGYHLIADSTKTTGLSWAEVPTTSPGGSDTHVQFNDGGAFGGEANFVYNETANTLGVTGTIDVVGNITVSGNVDGRDVSADGTTLDSVKAAPYVLISNDATLTGDRALTAGDAIKITDAGANSTVTLGVSLASTTDTQVLYSNGGLIGSEPNLVYEDTGNVLGLTGTLTVNGNIEPTADGTAGLGTLTSGFSGVYLADTVGTSVTLLQSTISGMSDNVIVTIDTATVDQTWPEDFFNGLFGDGVDGVSTPPTASTTDISRVLALEDLTINGGGTTFNLNPSSGGGSYMLYVNGTLTVNSGGTLRVQTSDGGDASGIAAGAAVISGGAGWFHGNAGSGGGGGGRSTAGNGSAGSNANPSGFSGLGNDGSDGGAGGNSPSNTGGSGGLGGTVVRNRLPAPYLQTPMFSGLVGTGRRGGGGGGGGGAGANESGTGSSGGGGGGGQGGGIMVVAARHIVCAGTISANGGSGGDGGDASGGGDNGGGGGGSGGGGGILYLVYETLTNTGTISATGGGGGAGGAPTGTGIAGTAGNPGSGGYVVKFNVRRCQYE